MIRVRRHIGRNAVAYLALFVALGGSAWAVAKIGPNDIMKNAVRSKHVKAGQVKPSDLARIRTTAIKPNLLVANNDPCDADDGPGRLQTGRFCGFDHGGSGGPPHWFDGDGFARSRFYKSNGIVYLSGSPRYQGYNSLATIFILPKGYRPAGTLAFSTYCESDTGTGAHIEYACLAKVFANGRVQLDANPAPIRNGTDAGTHLDGISFLAK